MNPSPPPLADPSAARRADHPNMLDARPTSHVKVPPRQVPTPAASAPVRDPLPENQAPPSEPGSARDALLLAASAVSLICYIVCSDAVRTLCAEVQRLLQKF